MIGAAQRLQFAARPVVRPITMPPPIKGWNTRDSLDGMDPLNAVTLDNWFIDGAGLKSRGGCSSFATGLGAGAVETLAEYYSGATRKLLGACSGSVFDVSAGGAVGAALGSGFGSNRWQSVMFNAKLMLVDGSDAGETFDGATLGATGFTGPSSPLVGIAVFKNRIYAWEKQANQFWYGGLNLITGAMTSFPLATVTDSGGNITLITTMSHDGGDGVQDYLCIFMSSGETVFYQGTDPSSATTFALAGRYHIAAPVNVRAVCRYGADAYVTTYDDHVQLSQALAALRQGTRPPKSEASGAVVDAAASGGASLFGWQAIYYRQGNRILFNVPNSNGTFYQHVYSVQAQAWSRFTGMNASSWSLFGEALYYGGAGGYVYPADTGATDVGNSIAVHATPAWDSLRMPQRKRITAVRALVVTSQPTSIAVGLGYDFCDINVPVAIATAPASSLWHVSPSDTSLSSTAPPL